MALARGPWRWGQAEGAVSVDSPAPTSPDPFPDGKPAASEPSSVQRALSGSEPAAVRTPGGQGGEAPQLAHVSRCEGLLSEKPDFPATLGWGRGL